MCTTSLISRPAACRRCSSRPPSSSRPRSRSPSARVSDSCPRLHAPPDAGPNRRGRCGPTPTRPSPRSSRPSPPTDPRRLISTAAAAPHRIAWTSAVALEIVDERDRTRPRRSVITAATRSHPTPAVHQCFHQPAAALPVAAVRIGACRVLTPAEPNAGSSPDAAPRAVRRAAGTRRIAGEPVGTTPRRDPSGTGSTPTNRRPGARRRRPPEPAWRSVADRRSASQHPGDVGVDDRDIGLERERENRRAVYAPTPGRASRPSSVAGNCAERAIRMAAACRFRPGADSRGLATAAARHRATPRRTSAGDRVRGQERVPLRDHPRSLGLLQHHLADEDGPGSRVRRHGRSRSLGRPHRRTSAESFDGQPVRA